MLFGGTVFEPVVAGGVGGSPRAVVHVDLEAERLSRVVQAQDERRGVVAGDGARGNVVEHFLVGQAVVPVHVVVPRRVMRAEVVADERFDVVVRLVTIRGGVPVGAVRLVAGTGRGGRGRGARVGKAGVRHAGGKDLGGGEFGVGGGDAVNDLHVLVTLVRGIVDELGDLVADFHGVFGALLHQVHANVGAFAVDLVALDVVGDRLRLEHVGQLERAVGQHGAGQLRVHVVADVVIVDVGERGGVGVVVFHQQVALQAVRCVVLASRREVGGLGEGALVGDAVGVGLLAFQLHDVAALNLVDDHLVLRGAGGHPHGVQRGAHGGHRVLRRRGVAAGVERRVEVLGVELLDGGVHELGLVAGGVEHALVRAGGHAGNVLLGVEGDGAVADAVVRLGGPAGQLVAVAAEVVLRGAVVVVGFDGQQEGRIGVVRHGGLVAARVPRGRVADQQVQHLRRGGVHEVQIQRADAVVVHRDDARGLRSPVDSRADAVGEDDLVLGDAVALGVDQVVHGVARAVGRRGHVERADERVAAGVLVVGHVVVVVRVILVGRGAGCRLARPAVGEQRGRRGSKAAVDVGGAVVHDVELRERVLAGDLVVARELVVRDGVAHHGRLVDEDELRGAVAGDARLRDRAVHVRGRGGAVGVVHRELLGLDGVVQRVTGHVVLVGGYVRVVGEVLGVGAGGAVQRLRGGVLRIALELLQVLHVGRVVPELDRVGGVGVGRVVQVEDGGRIAIDVFLVGGGVAVRIVHGGAGGDELVTLPSRLVGGVVRVHGELAGRADFNAAGDDAAQVAGRGGLRRRNGDDFLAVIAGGRRVGDAVLRDELDVVDDVGGRAGVPHGVHGVAASRHDEVRAEVEQLARGAQRGVEQLGFAAERLGDQVGARHVLVLQRDGLAVNGVVQLGGPADEVVAAALDGVRVVLRRRVGQADGAQRLVVDGLAVDGRVAVVELVARRVHERQRGGLRRVVQRQLDDRVLLDDRVGRRGREGGARLAHGDRRAVVRVAVERRGVGVGVRRGVVSLSRGNLVGNAVAARFDDGLERVAVAGDADVVDLVLDVVVGLPHGVQVPILGVDDREHPVVGGGDEAERLVCLVTAQLGFVFGKLGQLGVGQRVVVGAQQRDVVAQQGDARDALCDQPVSRTRVVAGRLAHVELDGGFHAADRGGVRDLLDGQPAAERVAGARHLMRQLDVGLVLRVDGGGAAGAPAHGFQALVERDDLVLGHVPQLQRRIWRFEARFQDVLVLADLERVGELVAQERLRLVVVGDADHLAGVGRARGVDHLGVEVLVALHAVPVHRVADLFGVEVDLQHERAVAVGVGAHDAAQDAAERVFGLVVLGVVAPVRVRVLGIVVGAACAVGAERLLQHVVAQREDLGVGVDRKRVDRHLAEEVLVPRVGSVVGEAFERVGRRRLGFVELVLVALVVLHRERGGRGLPHGVERLAADDGGVGAVIVGEPEGARAGSVGGIKVVEVGEVVVQRRGHVALGVVDQLPVCDFLVVLVEVRAVQAGDGAGGVDRVVLGVRPALEHVAGAVRGSAGGPAIGGGEHAAGRVGLVRRRVVVPGDGLAAVLVEDRTLLELQQLVDGLVVELEHERAVAAVIDRDRAAHDRFDRGAVAHVDGGAEELVVLVAVGVLQVRVRRELLAEQRGRGGVGERGVGVHAVFARHGFGADLDELVARAVVRAVDGVVLDGVADLHGLVVQLQVQRVGVFVPADDSARALAQVDCVRGAVRRVRVRERAVVEIGRRNELVALDGVGHGVGQQRIARNGVLDDAVFGVDGDFALGRALQRGGIVDMVPDQGARTGDLPVLHEEARVAARRPLGVERLLVARHDERVGVGRARAVRLSVPTGEVVARTAEDGFVGGVLGQVDGGFSLRRFLRLGVGPAALGVRCVQVELQRVGLRLVEHEQLVVVAGLQRDVHDGAHAVALVERRGELVAGVRDGRRVHVIAADEAEVVELGGVVAFERELLVGCVALNLLGVVAEQRDGVH